MHKIPIIQILQFFLCAGVSKDYVPETCCVLTVNGEYVDLAKCQLSNDGPPGQPSGSENEALHYRVSL